MIPYSLKPEEFKLKKLKDLIVGRKLHKSRAMLKEGIDDKFTAIFLLNIENVKQFNAHVSTKEKIELFSNESGIEIEYLVQLKREANSFFSKPVKLSAFPGIDVNLINKLEDIKISNSKILFEEVQQQGLQNMAKLLKTEEDNVLELFCLCDLARIWGVGTIFTRIVYFTGICSVQDFVKADPILAYKDFIMANNELKLTKALFIDSDIVFCNRMAQELRIVDYTSL